MALALGTTQCSDPHAPLPQASLDEVPAPPFVLVGAGDVAGCASQGDEKTALLVERVLSGNSNATAFIAGDNAYETGSAADYRNCYHPSWGRFKTRTRPSLGNHEYDSGSPTPSFDYFGDALWSGSRARGGYYSFNLGTSWHIIVLNSNSKFVPTAVGSPQEKWLKADLAANSRPCVAAIWHHPRFYSSADPTSSLQRGSIKPFWQALYAAGADLVLNGHSHNYERFALQNPDGVADAKNGIREFIVGMGGKSVSSATNVHPTSQVREGKTFGVLKLTLGAGSYSWEFLAEAGKSFTDTGRSDCHPGTGLVPNAPPVAFFGSACSRLSCTFTDRSRDSDGTVVAWRWVFADGASSTSRNPTHVYQAGGTYRVRLTVTDDRGATGSISHSVTLAP